MSPILRARAVYGERRSFEHDLELHLAYGYVVSTPRVFAMFRPVWSGAHESQLADINYWFTEAERDCWFVWSAAGPLKELLQVAPFPLKHIAFHRRLDPRLRIYNLARTRERAGLPSTQPSYV